MRRFRTTVINFSVKAYAFLFFLYRFMFFLIFTTAIGVTPTAKCFPNHSFLSLPYFFIVASFTLKMVPNNRIWQGNLRITLILLQLILYMIFPGCLLKLILLIWITTIWSGSTPWPGNRSGGSWNPRPLAMYRSWSWTGFRPWGRTWQWLMWSLGANWARPGPWFWYCRAGPGPRSWAYWAGSRPTLRRVSALWRRRTWPGRASWAFSRRSRSWSWFRRPWRPRRRIILSTYVIGTVMVCS